MKRVLFLAMCLVVGAASATDSPQTTSANTVVDSAAAASATNAGNSQTIVFTAPAETKTTVNQNVTGTTTNIVKQDQNVTVNGTQTQVIKGGTDSTVHQTFGTQTIRNTPSVSGGNLTSSNDTCMGSATGSANGPGFGISLGKTYVDENCKMLKNSRELWNMGMKGAAMALMCMDANNRAALEMTGFQCPQSGGPNRISTSATNVQPTAR